MDGLSPDNFTADDLEVRQAVRTDPESFMIPGLVLMALGMVPMASGMVLMTPGMVFMASGVVLLASGMVLMASGVALEGGRGTPRGVGGGREVRWPRLNILEPRQKINA